MHLKKTFKLTNKQVNNYFNFIKTVNYLNINKYKNLNLFYKALNFLQLVIQQNGKVLFILPTHRKYNVVNKYFSLVLKKYQHYYLIPNIKNQTKPGFLTNYIFSKNKNFIKKKPDLIFIINSSKNNNIFYNNLLKECALLNIPIINIIDHYNINTHITYPIISKIFFKNIIFFYFLISTILNIKKN